MSFLSSRRVLVLLVLSYNSLYSRSLPAGACYADEDIIVYCFLCMKALHNDTCLIWGDGPTLTLIAFDQITSSVLKHWWEQHQGYSPRFARQPS